MKLTIEWENTESEQWDKEQAELIESFALELLDYYSPVVHSERKSNASALE